MTASLIYYSPDLEPWDWDRAPNDQHVGTVNAETGEVTLNQPIQEPLDDGA